ncbi:MFS transporter [Fictibacillus sp. KU28468]|uniref:MFS transporter n=1 Tax=Fictibacillus sp. KU28468 TaxID=2991053 RepID=UPI0008E2DA96|nr:MFS transporter [Fictibacillus sp. KU28468]UZJ77095.1 MFS transporter [Fictibacillus sp. KU28468]SFD89084.1 MFS transporter, DHA1 family, multidrug resistance protein [Bacillus sp. OV194]
MYWKRSLWILWPANFLIAAGMSLIIPFLPLYIEKLGVSNIQSVEHWTGWIFSAQFITSFLFQPLWGSLADRYGRKVMLIRSAIGMGTVTALMGLVTGPEQLLVLRLINGLFSGFISMSISLQASVTPDKDAGRSLGTLQTGQIVGTLIGPLIGGFLSEIFGFEGVFFVTGGLILIAGMVVMFFIKEDVAVNKERSIKKKNEWGALKPLFPVFIAAAITQLAMMSIQPIITLYTRTIYHGSHLTLVVGLISAVTGIANLIGSPILGRIGDRYGQRKVLIFSLIMAAFAFLPQVLATDVKVLLAGRFLLGLFIGGMIPSLNVLVKKLAPPNLQATAFGISSSARFLGNLFGPLLGTFVAAAYNIKDIFYITMIFLLINMVSIVRNKKLELALRNHKKAS